MPIAYLLAGGVGFAGYHVRALSASGALAATLVGGTVLGFGGLTWAILLVLFFASSSLLSFFRRSDPRKLRAADLFEKGSTRDAAQVLANGGVAALLALLAGFADPWVGVALFCAYTGAIAAATADTWATEIGVLSRLPPRMITTGRRVDAGTSGAVTMLGSMAALGGALFIGVSAAVLNLPAEPLRGLTPALDRASVWWLMLGGLFGGLAGALADSLLGASVQAMYWCPRCNKPTESAVHKCGTAARYTHGWPAVNNDVVNLLATTVGAATALAVWLSGH